jgi:uncharacterized repeat protein (TIGR01451 family)
MERVFRENFKVIFILTLIALVGGVFGILNSYSGVRAEIEDWSDAVDIIGQEVSGVFNADQTGPNDGPTASVFDNPFDVEVDLDNDRLFVYDDENERVLIFNLVDGELVDYEADNVLGQDVFNQNRSGTYGYGEYSISSFAGAGSWDNLVAGGLAYDSDNDWLFVSNGNRVSVFDLSLEVTDGMDATYVLGQGAFNLNQTVVAQNSFAGEARGLAYDHDKDRLFVADSDGNRILVFDSFTVTEETCWESCDGEDAVNVLGQSDFITSDALTTQSGMDEPTDVVYDPGEPALGDERLFVTDSGNDRVLVFDISENDPGCEGGVNDGICDGEEAVNVLGQTDFISKGTGVTANNFYRSAQRLTFDNEGDRLFVTDDLRVMIFDVSSDDLNCATPNEGICDGEDAINLLGGATDFISYPSSVPSQSSFTYSPCSAGGCLRGVHYTNDGSDERLYVLDQDRLMIFDVADPIINGDNAIDLVGQREGLLPDWDRNGPNGGPKSTGLYNPVDIEFDEVNNRAFITDWVNRRVVVHNLDVSNDFVDYVADNILGGLLSLTTFTTNGEHFADPYGLAYDENNNYLFVSTRGTSKVLVYDVNNIVNDEDYIYELGGTGLDQHLMDETRGLAYDSTNDRLFVADTDNHRVMVFDLSLGIEDDMDASFVLGQPDFVTNDELTTQSGMSEPYDVDVDISDGGERLFVSEFGNKRVTVFDVRDSGSDAMDLCNNGTMTTGLASGMNASCVLGESNFTSSTGGADSQSNLAYNMGVSYHDNRLFVGTIGGVIVFDVNSITNGEDAQNYLGKSTWSSYGSAPTLRDFGYSYARGLDYNSSNDRLYVPAMDSNRLSVFDAEEVSVAPTSPSNCFISSRYAESLKVNWNDNSDDETGFDVEISTDGISYSLYDSVDPDDESKGVYPLLPFTDYWFRVKANGDSEDSDYTTCDMVTMRPTAPADPALSLPADEATDVSINPTFTFATSFTYGEVVKYIIELAAHENFTYTSFVFDQRESSLGWSDTAYSSDEEASFTLPNSISLNTSASYYWRVKAIGVDGEMTTSEMYSFTTIGSSAQEEADVAFVETFTNLGFIDGSALASLSEGSYIPAILGSNAIGVPATNTWATAQSIGSSENTSELHVFDYDSDGDMDLLEDNGTSADSYLYENSDGEGTFVQAESIGTSINALLVGDLDNDGDQDILKIGDDLTNHYWVENDGDGTWSTHDDVEDSLFSFDADEGALGDVDNDGDLDLVIVTSGDNKILLNDGMGEFEELTLSFDVTDNSTGVAIDDVSGDGWNDIIVANYRSQSYVYVNDRDSSFTRTNAFVTEEQYTTNVITGDFDIDGDNDMIVGGAGGDGYYYYNNGTGLFLYGSGSNTGFELGNSVRAGDVDNDGDQDVISANSAATYLYRNSGGDMWEQGETLYSGTSNDAVIADFDGDGDNDIVVAIDGQNKLYLNETELVFDNVDFSGDGGDMPIGMFDSDNDGDLDIFNIWSTEEEEWGCELWVNDGEQNYTELSVFDDCGYSESQSFFDINQDGYIDVLIPGEETVSQIFINDGDNDFSEINGAFDHGSVEVEQMIPIDVELDGDWDLLLAVDDAPHQLWLNNGSESFVEVDEPLGDTFGIGEAVAVADFDRDGYDDIFVSWGGIPGTSVYFNQQDGSFSEVSVDSGGYERVNVIDLGNDGDMDLVVEGGRFYINDGQGNFSSQIQLFTPENSKIPEVVDINRDGNFDIVIAGDDSIAMNNDEIHFGYNGDGFVSSTSVIDDDIYNLAVSAGDYDSDGDDDLLFIPADDSLSTMMVQKQTYTTGANYVMQSIEIDTTDDDISSVTLTADDSIPTGSSILYYINAGASTEADQYEEVDFGVVEPVINGTAHFASDEADYYSVYGDDGLISLQMDDSEWMTLPVFTSENFYNFDQLPLDGADYFSVGVGSGGTIYNVADEITQFCDGTTTEDLYAISKDSDWEMGFAVGDNGTMVQLDMTDEENVVCSLVATGTVSDLRFVEVLDEDKILIGGTGGVLLSTEDGGDNWVDLSGGLENDFLGSIPVDVDAMVVGSNGLLAIINGLEPEIIETGTSEDLNYITTVWDNEDEIAVVGDGGVVLISEDGGETWDDSNSVLTAVDLIGYANFTGDEDTGYSAYAVSDSTLYGENSDDSTNYVWEGPLTSGEEFSLTNAGSSLRWKAVLSTTDANANPVLDSLSISYSIEEVVSTNSSVLFIPTSPVAEDADVLGSTSIQWNFEDTANNELGFKLADEEGVLVTQVPTPGLGYIIESDLVPNTLYSRQVASYNNDGNSNYVDLGEYSTLANIPFIETVNVNSNTSVSLTLDTNDNPSYTNYAIYEPGAALWLQADGTLGDNEVYQTYAEWLNGGSSILISGLTTNARYEFMAKAINEDGIETEFSSSVSVLVNQPEGASIILTKSVGVNVDQQVAQGFYMGSVVSAGQGGDWVNVLPVYSEWLNLFLIGGGLLALILALFLVMNVRDGNFIGKLKHLKHTHKIFFNDLARKKGDDLYYLLNGENAKTEGRAYSRHHVIYRYTGATVMSVMMAGIGKLAVIGAMMALVYGGVGVIAFENQAGEAVHQGDVLTYRIDYTNNGTETATTVSVTDTVPVGLTYMETSLSDGCSYVAGEISCLAVEVLPQGTGYFEFMASVSVAVGESIVNIAQATFDQSIESVSSNSVSNEIDLSADPDLIGPGQTLETTLLPGWNFFKMAETAKVQFPHRDGLHAVELVDSSLEATQGSLRITSDPIDVTSSQGEVSSVDTDLNGQNDLSVKIQSIESDTVAIVGIRQDVEADGPGEVCGNDFCGAGETCGTCEVDCGVCPVLPVCGDNSCNGAETCLTCEADCGVCPPPPICGDNVCSGIENCSTCVGDCGACPPPPICGDNACNGDETCDSCELDCGICLVVPVCGDNECNGDETCDSCSDDCGVCAVGASCGDNSCDENESCETCESDCGECEVIDILIEDNVEEIIIKIKNGGKDLFKDPELIEKINEIDDKKEWNKTEPERELELEFEINETTEVLEKVLPVETAAKVSRASKVVQKFTVDNPILEKINYNVKNTTVTTVTAASIASVATVGATSATGASLLAYLQLLFTQPLLLFVRKKKRGWGVVYNSVTKQPVDLAIVRVFNSETKRLVGTKVTDKHGRYQFILNPGKYYLEVSKKGLAYPCELLEHQEKDDVYEELYYGEEFEVHERDAVSWPIPVDPNVKESTVGQEMRRYWGRKVQLFLTLFAPLIALVSWVIAPSWKMTALVVSQLLLLMLFNRLARGPKINGWGLVKDAQVDKGLKRSIVRVFDTKFNKLLETQVTDNKGRYAFLVGNQEYYMTAEKIGYEKKQTEVIQPKEKPGYLAENIKLKKYVKK